METVNQDVTKDTQEGEGKQTFTQEEVNKIVADRIKREREKYSDYETLKGKADKFDEIKSANKSELDKVRERNTTLETELATLRKNEEIRLLKETIASECGVPLNVLSGEDEESLRAQATAIKDLIKGNAYPSIKDGGESVPPTKKSTRDQFAEWVENVI